MAYSEEVKHQAVKLIAAHGGKLSDELILVIRETLGVSVKMRTLYNWWTSAKAEVQIATVQIAEKKTAPDLPISPAPVSAIVSADESSNATLIPKLRRAAHKFIDHAASDDEIKKINSLKAMTAAGIAIDKLLKLEGVPDVVIDVTISFLDVAKRKGLDPEQALRTLTDKMAQLPDVERRMN